MDLAVEGLLALPDGTRKGVLGIDLRTGGIVAIKKTLKADTTLDFGDRLVTPGAIDVHVHFREPGLTKKEDWATGTKAAAMGGVTTVFDMPNTKPPSLDAESLAEKYRLAKRKACIDFGLWAGAKPERGLRFLAAASGLKIFLGPTTGDPVSPTREQLAEWLAAAANAKIPVAVHAEDAAKFRELPRPPKSLEDHDKMRPPEAEASAIRTLLETHNASGTKPKLHVAHLTSQAGLAALGDAKVSFGITPHHLLLDTRARLGTKGKVNPPLRTMADKVTLDVLGDPRALLESDHAPHLPEEKDDEFDQAPSGVPGVETMVPLLMARALRGELPPERIVTLACRRPAELMGLATGTLAIGMPADLAVWSKRDLAPVRGDRLHSKCGWTPFEGHDAVFPSHVIRRGAVVVEDHDFHGRGGVGEFVRPGSPNLAEPA